MAIPATTSLLVGYVLLFAAYLLGTLGTGFLVLGYAQKSTAAQHESLKTHFVWKGEIADRSPLLSHQQVYPSGGENEGATKVQEAVLEEMNDSVSY